MSASQQVHAPGFSPAPARVEPPADCANARAGGTSRMPPTPYSDEEIATIHRMRREGATWQQVADATGRNKKALEMAAPRLGAVGIGVTAWKPEHIATLRRMVEARLHSPREIAAALNRSVVAVQSKIAELYGKKKRVRRKAPAVDRHRAQQHAERLKPAPVVSQTKERRCLCGCNRMFASTGPGNRISPECVEAFNKRHTGAA